VKLLFLDGEPIPTPGLRESSRDRVALAAEDDAWELDRSLGVFRSRDGEALPPSPVFHPLEVFPGAEAPVSGAAGAWPELPPAPRAESDEAMAELREWERLRRLDREQRGE
jgi:hypothetical protein